MRDRLEGESRGREINWKLYDFAVLESENLELVKTLDIICFNICILEIRK